MKERKKSVIYPGVGITTDMYFPPYYDEEGEYHNHDGNATSYECTCSNGHKWNVTKRNRCPNPKCDWNK